MRIIDLTNTEGQSPEAGDVRELSKAELKNLSGGSSAFLRGDIVDSQAAELSLATKTDGAQAASFPTHISNARFTQSATTLCNWSGCTSYISGC